MSGKSMRNGKAPLCLISIQSVCVGREVAATATAVYKYDKIIRTKWVVQGFVVDD